jgi:hypothetical protein
MSLHVGVTAVFKMSAASSNSSATANQRPSVRRTSFFAAAGIAAHEDNHCFHTCLNGDECDHHCRGKFDNPRYNFDKVFGLFTQPSHKYQLDTSGANRLYNFLDRLADLNRADEPNSR